MLQQAAVEGGDVATDGKCKVEECNKGSWEGEKGVSEKKVFKVKVDENVDRLYADMRNGANRFGREQIVKGRETGVRGNAKEFVCEEKVG